MRDVEGITKYGLELLNKHSHKLDVDEREWGCLPHAHRCCGGAFFAALRARLSKPLCSVGRPRAGGHRRHGGRLQPARDQPGEECAQEVPRQRPRQPADGEFSGSTSGAMRAGVAQLANTWFTFVVRACTLRRWAASWRLRSCTRRSWRRIQPTASCSNAWCAPCTVNSACLCPSGSSAQAARPTGGSAGPRESDRAHAQCVAAPHPLSQAGLRRGKGDLAGAADLLKEYLQVGCSTGPACQLCWAFSLLASSPACSA